MNVELCKNAARWDAYVNAQLEASNYQRWGWGEVVDQTFGHECYYLMAREGENVSGVLPLIRMKSHLFGHFLVSMPFFSYGGVLASTSTARAALTAKAIELAQELKVSHIELRQAYPMPIEWNDTTAKVTMELDLPETVETLWKGLSSGMRNKVRNAQKNKFRVEWQGESGVDSFYRIFSTNMRNLGTPVYPRYWFSNLCRKFPEEVRILTLWDGDEPIASGLVTLFRKALELPWSATIVESRKRYSAVYLYWSLLEWAISNGYRRVDFGRCTRGSGVYEFKRHWGCQERPLHWYYWLAAGTAVPELRPDNPRYHLATEMWKRLPLPVANILGPRIVRSIP